MRVHWLQHAEHEELGCIAPWLAQRKHKVTRTRLFDGDELPSTLDFDWLIVMGGPMNIYEHEAYPCLLQEKSLINDACVTNKKVLGICLGAQLISDVLGGPVTRSPEPEIGWFDVFLSDEARNSEIFGGLPSQFPAFHWHGDTFAPPDGAASLMRSEACPNQGFVVQGGRICALQLHLEVRREDAAVWLSEDPPRPARYVQTPAQMLRPDAPFAANRALMNDLLTRFAR